jgi:formamidopyrimidine-DNA glycosylase
MPELPEVETIRRGLQKTLIGKTIKSFWSDWPKKVAPSVDRVTKEIVGKKVVAVDRRAKVLIIRLNNNTALLFHLKMSGQLIYQPKKGRVVFGGHPQYGGLNNLPNKFTHHLIQFAEKSTLFFNDQRKFGWIKFVTAAELQQIFETTGIEPLSKDFTKKIFLRLLTRYPNRTIKQTLLDQSLVAGIGNIYADESLFAARIRPERKVKSVQLVEMSKLYRAIKKILTLAVKYKGTSTNLYVGHDGQPGNFVRYLKVYGRGAMPCKRCRTPIKKLKLHGRGTHYCLKCQK